MTLLEKIKAFDDVGMATFIYTVVTETEDRIMGQLSALGVDASICRLDPDVQIESHRLKLHEEVDDE